MTQHLFLHVAVPVAGRFYRPRWYRPALILTAGFLLPLVPDYPDCLPLGAYLP